MVEELERSMWEAAVRKDKQAFLNIVDENAVMVCGGYRCTGSEYAEYIADFDCRQYEIMGFETVAEDDNLIQVHYVIKTEVADEKNKDLAGTFHITSTWAKKSGQWKLVFNMDSRVVE